MRRIRNWFACVLTVLLGLGIWASTWGDEGGAAQLQQYIVDNPQARTVYVGDSWYFGFPYPGRVRNPATGIPYTFAQSWADPTCSTGSEFPQSLSRRLGTNRFAVLGQGSMELMLDDDASDGRAQQDSSIFGVMRPYYEELYRPDIVILPGGGGGNDQISGGSDYAELRAEAITTARRAIETFRGADWIVWISPRPFALFNFAAQSGTSDQKRPLAVAQYDIWEDFNTFVSDTLRTSLAAAGVNVNKFVTFNSWDYAVGDTTGMYTLFDCSSGGEYATVQHMRWSPASWYRSDKVHLNDYGSKSYADSIATHLFGVDLSNSYTKGAGSTIYCDLESGNNWTNRMDCLDRGTPLSTVQAAVDQAHPGDIVKVIGSGNQAVTAYDTTGSAWISARQYELRVVKPGITIVLEDGAYFKGIYDATSVDIANAETTVGSGFLDPVKCTAGTILDTLSHYASITSFYTAKPDIDLDLTISGTEGGDNWLCGYQVPVLYRNYDRVTLKHLSLTGGVGSPGYTIGIYNAGGTDMSLFVEDCTFYSDSATVSGAGIVEISTWDGSTAFALNDTTGFDGWFKRCNFYGKSGVTVNAITGCLQNFKFIECLWSDPDVTTNWLNFGSTPDIPTGLFAPMWFINCAWRTTDNIATTYALKYAQDGEDSLYFINCDFTAPNVSSAFIVDFQVNAGTGMEVYCAGTAFVRADYNSGTDLTAAAAGAATTVTDGYSIHSYNTKSLGITGDTLVFGGVMSFAGYDLTDDFGVTHGTLHASIGPIQYENDPILWTSGAIQGRASYATLAGPWEALRLVNNGVLTTSSATDTDTWFEIPRIYNESDMAVARSFLDAWEKWPAANQAKVRFKVSGEPVTTITAADGSVYQTLGALDAAITATTESASDSLTASTWFTLPRPYNLNAAFQIEILRAWHRTLAEANRKLIRFRVAGTDYSMTDADSVYSQGLWGLLADIGTGATASDSLNAATWFLAPRVYDMAQAQQFGVYQDAWKGWPLATQKKVRVKTK